MKKTIYLFILTIMACSVKENKDNQQQRLIRGSTKLSELNQFIDNIIITADSLVLKTLKQKSVIEDSKNRQKKLDRIVNTYQFDSLCLYFEIGMYFKNGKEKSINSRIICKNFNQSTISFNAYAYTKSGYSDNPVKVVVRMYKRRPFKVNNCMYNYTLSIEYATDSIDGKGFICTYDSILPDSLGVFVDREINDGIKFRNLMTARQ